MAWPHDPRAVAAAMGNRGGAVRRGIGYYESLEQAVKAVPDAAKAVANFGSRLLQPASEHIARPAYAAMKGIGQYAVKHPRLASTAVGAAVLAPILGASFQASQNRNEDQLMNLRENPGRDITASDKQADWNGPMSAGQFGGQVQSGIASGIASGLSQGVVQGLGGLIGGGLGALKDAFTTDRQRQQIFTAVLKTDPVISAAVEQNPAAAQSLKEAYATMCRFAPSLALDLNAVRSLLREVVVTGSGLNYVTIKNLIETEGALAKMKHASADAEVEAALPAEIKEAIERFGFGKLAAHVYRVNELDERTTFRIIGEKLASRIAERRTVNAGLRALQALSK